MEPTGAAVAVVAVAHQQQHQQQQQQQLEIPPFLTKATVYAITGVGADGSNSIASSSSATMSVEKEDPPALPLLVLLPPSPSPSPPAAAADDDLGHEANGYDHGHDDDDDVSVGERWNHEVGVCAEDSHSDVSSASSNSICKSSSNSTRSSPSLSQAPRGLHSPDSPDRPNAAPWPPEGAQPSVEPSEPRGLVFVTAPTCATGSVCARSTNVVRIQIVPEEPEPVKSPTDCNNNQHNGLEHDDSREATDRGRVTVSQGGNSSTAPAQVTVISFGGDDQKQEQEPVIDPESLLPSPPIVATDTASQPTSLISTHPGTGVTMVQRGVATGDATTVSDAVDAANFGDSPYVYYMAAAAASKVRTGSTGGGGGGGGGGGESVVGGSGQCSPSDTLDSGTCSDIEVTPTPPPLPKKMSKLGGSVHISNHTSSGAVVGPVAAGGGGGRQMAIDNGDRSTNVIGRPRTADANHQLDQHQHRPQHRLGGPPSNDDGDDDDNDDGGDDDDDENRRQQQQQQPPKQQKHKPYGHGTRRSTVRSRGCASDSDDSESCLSSDSLNFSDHHQQPALGPAEEPTTRPPSSEHPSGTSSRKRHLLLRADGGTGAGGGILPDSLLAAIRGSRPRVYDEAKLMLLTKPTPSPLTNDGEGCDDEHVGEGSVLLTTTRSILMDKINSLMHREGLEATRTQQSTQPHNHHPSINNNNSSGTRGSAMVATGDSVRSNQFESDRYYNFHIHERSGGDGATGGTADGPGSRSSPETTPPSVVGGDLNSNDDDGSFAGLKDLTSGTSTIRSNKGTVRGVKNRVRNGIATFLQMQQTTGMKNYKDKEAGKVVVYSTSMGIVRETYTKCMNVKQILRTLLIKFEEKDIFMSNEYQQEIRERMQTDCVTVPQVFVDGQHVGDAECIERLNENGELRKMLKPYKCLDSPYTCKVCGGYRLLPCPSCGGSKKSIHRNHFTAEFVALKCMNCDEVGLVKCHNC